MCKLLQCFGLHFNRHLLDDCDGDEGNGPIYGYHAMLWVGAERGVSVPLIAGQGSMSGQSCGICDA